MNTEISLPSTPGGSSKYRRLLPLKLFILALIIAAALSAAQIRRVPADERALANVILKDAQLKAARTRMQGVLKQGLNAGGHYNEVWIRDLNTFAAASVRAGNASAIREALLVFLDFQRPDGAIVDGVVPYSDQMTDYQYSRVAAQPNLRGFKNTVESDQESSLILAFGQYIKSTGDYAILHEMRNGRTVLAGMEAALNFLVQQRTDVRTGLLWGGTTADWGDVQPEEHVGIVLDSNSHRAINIYDNAMFILALRQFIQWLPPHTAARAAWSSRLEAHVKNTRQYLWDDRRHKFIPHLYLEGSPFPPTFDEDAINFHGGTAVAIEAGLLDSTEIQEVHDNLRRSMAKVRAQTVSLTIEPAYPAGSFLNTMMGPYEYQNGGEWDWFGCRWVLQMLRHQQVQAAYDDLKPIVARQLRIGLYEWFTLAGEPRGANDFKGSAGVCSEAIDAMDDWAVQRKHSYRWVKQEKSDT